MIASKDIDVIIYNSHKNLYFSEKEREEKLFHDVHLANGLKARIDAKRHIAQQLQLHLKKVQSKRCPYELKEDFIEWVELNSSKKVILRKVDILATYKLSDISLEYDPIIDKSHVTIIGNCILEQHRSHIPR